MTKIKFFISYFVFFITLVSYSQTPNQISYQMVIRDNANQLVGNRLIRLRISLVADSMNAISSYVETHQVTSNSQGLVQLAIGGGTVVTGSFGSIPWSRGKMFDKIEIDPAGGTNYTLSSTTQLLSVPYAQYAGDLPVSKSGDTVRIGNAKLLIPGSVLLSSGAGNAPASLSEGLVAYYPFNGNANDMSGNGNHGVVNGPVLSTDRLGNNARSFLFDGVNDFIFASVKNLPLNNSKRSFSAFINLQPDPFYTDWYCIFSYGISSPNVAGQVNDIFIGEKNKDMIYLNNDDYATKSKSLPNLSGRWIHFAITYDGINLGNIKIYIDGVEQPKSIENFNNINSLVTNNTDLHIGKTFMSYANRNYFFRGNIDDIRIYNRVLTQSEIEYLANN